MGKKKMPILLFTVHMIRYGICMREIVKFSIQLIICKEC